MCVLLWNGTLFLLLVPYAWRCHIISIDGWLNISNFFSYFLEEIIFSIQRRTKFVVYMIFINRWLKTLSVYHKSLKTFILQQTKAQTYQHLKDLKITNHSFSRPQYIPCHWQSTKNNRRTSVIYDMICFEAHIQKHKHKGKSLLSWVFSYLQIFDQKPYDKNQTHYTNHR